MMYDVMWNSIQCCKSNFTTTC